MEGGFLLHGDISDERIAKACLKVVNEIYTFIQLHLLMNEADLFIFDDFPQLNYGDRVKFNPILKWKPAIKKSVQQVRQFFEDTKHRLQQKIKKKAVENYNCRETVRNKDFKLIPQEDLYDEGKSWDL